MTDHPTINTTAVRIATVGAPAFKRAARLAAHIARNARGYETEDYVHIEADGSYLTFRTNMGSTYHESWCVATIEAPGSAYVRPKELLALLTGLKGNIEIHLGADRLFIGDFVLGRRDCTDSDFVDCLPPRKAFYPSAYWSLRADELLAGINAVKASMSKEESRYYLCGAFLDTDAGKIVATDGHKAQAFQLRSGEPQAGMPSVIVADRQIESWAKALKDCGKDALAVITVGSEDKDADGGRPTAVALHCEAGRIEGMLIDGAYPDYEKAWENTSDASKSEVAWPSAKLAAFAKIVDAKARAGICGISDRVQIEARDGQLWARETGSDGGEPVHMGNSVPPGIDRKMTLIAKHVVATAAVADDAIVYLPQVNPKSGDIRGRVLIRAGSLDTILVTHRW